uniref:Uncharacterized protein n=1 Tax=Callorhinchus milii TaxID=7868 RepID=A0A4W3H009_CALMI
MLRQHSAQDLDLNTPNSEGLVPLDIAIMTNNVPVARILLKAGAKESPHFVSLESRALHLDRLVEEAQERGDELSTQLHNEVLSLERPETEKLLKAWEWRHKLYQRMRAGFQHASQCHKVHAAQCGDSTSLSVIIKCPGGVGRGNTNG